MFRHLIGEPDLKVIVQPADRSAIVASSGPPQFVPAAQLAQSQEQLATLQSHVTQAIDEYKSAYPMELKFDYTFKANEAPFDIQSIYHDDQFTYIHTNAPEKFSVYEIRDGKPNLITYDLREGTYIIPKVMDNGYVELGKKRMELLALHEGITAMAGDNSPPTSIRNRNSVARKSSPRECCKGTSRCSCTWARAILVIVAAIFSSTGKKTQGTKGLPPQPMVQDNTDNNVQDLKNQLQAEQQKEQPQAAYPNPDYAPGGRYFGCVPGQVCTPEMQQQNPQAQQLTPEQQQEQQLAAKDRELAYNARFASNIAYSRPPDPPPGQRSHRRRQASATAH